jgi:aryl-alcohol dehydrogenase-like predicted oxidoreductase
MEYVQFGSAGVRVSRLALGLGLRGQSDEREAERLILRAYEGGITLFDCANVYGLRDDRAYAGRSEEILGRALKGKREDVVITSKVVSKVGPGTNDRGASRYHVLREVERSLRRLDTDRIDVYLLHAFDTETPLEEQFRALDDLVRQGKVRYVGVCNYQAWQVCRALWVQERLNAAPLITVQNQYSLLNRALEVEMFPLLRAMGLGAMAYSPLAVGLLSGAYRLGEPPPAGSYWAARPPDDFARALAGPAGETVNAVRTVAERTGATVAQVALNWVLTRPEITVAISGADTDQQMDENLGAVDVQLSTDDLALLDEVSSRVVAAA